MYLFWIPLRFWVIDEIFPQIIPAAEYLICSFLCVYVCVGLENAKMCVHKKAKSLMYVR